MRKVHKLGPSNFETVWLATLQGQCRLFFAVFKGRLGSDYFVVLIIFYADSFLRALLIILAHFSHRDALKIVLIFMWFRSLSGYRKSFDDLVEG